MACMQDDFKKDVILGGRFKTISPLNHGTFGMVFKARDLNTGDTVALKCLTKKLPEGMQSPCPSALAIDDRSEELEIHNRIGHHRNIVNLVASFETENHAYLALEYCANGDLYEAIRAGKGPLETEHVRDFMLQLVNAVMCLHDNGIYHRDIKPENIFLARDGSMKLGDFGLATTESWTNEYGVGSDRYMAPEQFDSTATGGYAPAAADIWAIGICLLNVLFGRNPFAMPTHNDPLFADYVHDRQSLFDVFPNMSQDTYNVLVQCLALDPTRRSLTAVRDALHAVVSFTTDDESLDDFCSGSDNVGATQGREPLRTPSVTSPQVDSGNSFPWAKALQTSPQKHQRQLSVIQDEEMYPAPAKKSFEPDVASLASALDSGIGMSYKSSNVSTAPISVPFSTSLPTSRAMASIYGKDSELFSKSWSDLWEEEEEEKQRSSLDMEDHHFDLAPFRPEESYLTTRSSTPAIDIKPSSRGSSTPRMGLSELSNANSRSQSPSLPRLGQFSFGHFAKSAPQKDAPLKRTGSSLMDKWAALGNLRRTNNTTPQTPRHATGTNTPTKPTPTPITNTKRSKTRDRSGSWRKNTPGTSPFSNERWNLSKDWRSPQQPNYTTEPLPSFTPAKSRNSGLFTQQRRKSPRRGQASSNDDIGDLEWNGGWLDLHS
ncbi:Protein kinase domain-containing protein 34 [Elsinoe fawcettii]|nr:Protein kinase domain-containing protein 34 [Elsinoe fawcettii]